MPTSLSKYLDPAALDETIVNIRQIVEVLEEEMQNLPYARPDGLYPDMTVGAVIGADETAQWATRESTGSGAATVRSVQGAAEVQDGELVPVRIAGIRSVGFNQWDEEWELGSLDADGQPASGTSIRSKNFIPVVPSTAYYIAGLTSGVLRPFYYDSEKAFISRDYWSGGTSNNPFTIPSTARYMKFSMASSYGSAYNNDICINISDPARNGTYEPYRIVDAIEWPEHTLRAAGSVADMLYSDHVDVRVGERAYQSGDESDATMRTDGTTTYYPLTAPTTQPISPALTMTYKVQAGGSESIIVPAGEVSATPVLTVAEPVNMSTELARIWAAIESLGYTRNTAQLSRPVSLTDIGSIDEVQKDTADVADIEITKEVQE